MERQRGAPMWIHGSAVVVGERGVLIRGSAGAGKTSLALTLIREGPRFGRFVRLVADDTVGLYAVGHKIVARPHPRTAGLIEQRGRGIVPVEYEPACVIGLVADLVEATATLAATLRMPEPVDLRTGLLGVTVPRLLLVVGTSSVDNAHRVLDACVTFSAGS